MTDFFVNNALKFVQNNEIYSEYELLKIRYGLEGIFLTITKVIIILLIGVIFKYLDVVLLTLLFFNILRFFAFGLHAKESWQCLILSILQFNILPYLLLNIAISKSLIIIVGIISFLSFLLFAPSDTEKRPLTNKKKRLIRKILSLLSVLLFILIAFYSNKLLVPIIGSLIIESLMVNPLSYKLLGLKYNNYKNKEVKK